MIEAIVILERTTYEPEDPEDPDSMESFMLDEWHVVAVQHAPTKRTCECDYEKPLTLCAAHTVEYEIDSIGPRALWGDEIPEGLTPEAGKILVRGTMRWTPCGGGWWNDDAGSESDFEIAELRVLAPNKPRSEER